MLTGERELYRRFVVYDDEELLQILTTERAKYRSEALAAAEVVLIQRGVPLPPTLLTAPTLAAPYVKAQARPKSPYQLVDLVVDALMVGFLFWAIQKLAHWTVGSLDGVLGIIAYIILLSGLIGSMASLRRKWREKKW